MEPNDDPKLRELLREWKVEHAPSSLDARVLPPRRSWWRFLFTGSLPVPVPVALAAMFALIVMGAALLRRPATLPGAAKPISLVDFRPVEQPAFRVVASRYEAR